MTQRQLIELSVRAKYNAARTGGYSPVTMSQPGTPINGTGPATNASSSPVTGKSFTKEQMLAELKKQYSNLDSFDNNKADTVDASLVKANTIGVEFKYPWVAYKLWKTKTMAAELKELKSAEDQVGFILTMSQKRYGGKMLARPVKNLLRHIKSNYE